MHSKRLILLIRDHDQAHLLRCCKDPLRTTVDLRNRIAIAGLLE
jgi:hypothetical protein